MKFIQSLYLSDKKDWSRWKSFDTDKKIWQLSNIYLNKYGVNCEFWGCEKGIQFIKDAGLKYSRIEKIPDLDLDCRLWSMSKLYVASMQAEPFLHVDGDVFLKRIEFDSLPEFIVQNKEYYFSGRANYWFYEFMGFLCQTCNIELYEYIKKISSKIPPAIYNFGIFGGHSNVIPKICSDVYSYAIKVTNDLHKLDQDIFATCVLEQILVPMMAIHRGVNPYCYLDGSIYDDLILDAKQKGYCHLIGPTKTEVGVVRMVEERIKELMYQQ